MLDAEKFGGILTTAGSNLSEYWLYLCGGALDLFYFASILSNGE